MKNRYYDEWEFKQALSFIETNPLIANLKFKNYLKKYPTDYSAQIFYISTLITLGNFEEAEKILETLKFSFEIDKDYQNNVNKTIQRKIKLNIISSTLRLLSYQEKYKELYQYYLLHINDIKELDIDIKKLIFYCKKKLDMLDINKREQHNYIFRQIISYEENDFLVHIKKHLIAEETNSSIFSNDFPLNEILIEIKNYILASKRIYPYLYADTYIFKYNNSGKVNDKSVDYFEVICFHNTSNIITMYPTECCEELPYIDLNYLIKNNNPKTKKLSQIDKFNKRYGVK